MSVLATDDFTRANALNLGGNWTNSSGSSSLWDVSSNQAVNDGGGVSLEGYTATSAPANQYSKCTLKTLKGVSDEGPGPAVRLSTTVLSGYFAQCNTVEIKLYRVVAGTFAQLGSDAAAAAVNDVIEIDANGTSITVKKNGSTIIGPITDALIATGNWGLWFGGGTGTADFAVDDWEGGDFSGGGETITVDKWLSQERVIRGPRYRTVPSGLTPPTKVN